MYVAFGFLPQCYCFVNSSANAFSEEEITSTIGIIQTLNG
jgi:hypothetical protein